MQDCAVLPQGPSVSPTVRYVLSTGHHAPILAIWWVSSCITLDSLTQTKEC